MEVEIKITIRPENVFNKDELISDINWQFSEITGYEPFDIEINKI